jgi:hypothetical protein
VSVRALADILHDGKDESDKTDGDSGTIDATARVFPFNAHSSCSSSSSSNDDNLRAEWTRIQDLHDLRLAIAALADAKSMPITWPTSSHNGIKSFQVSNMTYDNNAEIGNSALQDDDGLAQKNVQDDLEAFLSSTDHLATHAAGAAGESDEEDEEYE